MKYNLAVSPINWRNDDLPDIGAENTLEKFLTEAAEVGYAGVELGAQFPKTPAEVEALLGAYNLSLASGWFDIGLLTKPPAEQFAEIMPHLDILQALNCPVVVICETQGTTVHNKLQQSVNGRRILGAEEWARLLPRLAEFAQRLQDYGLPLAYHPHVGTVVESAEDIERVLESCPQVGLLFDGGHLAYAGAEPLEIWHKYESRINHIHLKDVRRAIIAQTRSQNLSFLQGVLAGTFTVPGDGDLDYVALLAAMRQSQYEGWLVVEAEQDPAKAPAAVYARQALDYVQQQLTKQH